MGRARSCMQAVATTANFNNVLGRRRGANANTPAGADAPIFCVQSLMAPYTHSLEVYEEGFYEEGLRVSESLDGQEHAHLLPMSVDDMLEMFTNPEANAFAGSERETEDGSLIKFFRSDRPSEDGSGYFSVDATAPEGYSLYARLTGLELRRLQALLVQASNRRARST